MYDSVDFIHYGVIACAIATNSISVGISQGLTSYSALNAINRQPSARNDIIRVALIGMTLIETVAILALLVAILLLVNTPAHNTNYFAYFSEIGIALAISITGFVIGLASSVPAQAACHAVARQPLFTQKIFSFMLMTQVLIQTPVISALIVSLFIQGQAAYATVMSDSLRLIASGLCVGLGSIGPAIGLSIFSRAAINGIARNTQSYSKLLSFTFISEAIIETPIIFCLIIAVTLLFIVPRPVTDNLLDGIIFIAAGLCTGLGTLGTGISSGATGAAACSQIADNPETYSILSRTSMLAQGVIETIVIYAVLLSFLMILFK
jgi:F-type H+-transporting ATPase subunit c